MNHSIPFDAAAIRRYGVDRWCAEYPVPVHWRDFSAFVDALFAGLENVFVSLDRRDQEILIATSDFIIALRDVLYFEAFEAWAIAHAMTVDAEPATRAALTPDSPRIVDPFAAASAQQMSLHMRSVVRTWVENKHLTPLHRVVASVSGLCAHGSKWSVGTMGGLKRRWLSALGEPVRTIYADVLITRAMRAGPARCSVGLAQALDEFAAVLGRALTATLGRELPKASFSLATLIASWKKRAAIAGGLIDAIERDVRHPPEQLYLNEVWKPNHRALCLALRRKGTEIVAFAHGNDPMHVLQPQHAFMAFGHITTYVCETPASAAAHATYLKSSPVSSVFPVSFKSADTTEYVELFDRAKPPALVSAPTRVMVIGYPMLPHRTQFDVTNGLAMHLEGELRILGMLRSRGFYTIYKAHPETRAQAIGLFDGKADEVEYAPFERVVENADIIVFLTTVSSTFGAAMCTRKPVVVLNPDGKAWNPLVEDLYARRCRLVRAWIDGNNRIQLDEDAFWRSLELPGTLPSFELVERVFTPVAWKGRAPVDRPLVLPTTTNAETDQ